jgi:hypothetical protein
MMDECEVVRWLLAKRPAEWSDDERRRVTEHLASCVDCAALARDCAEQDRRLGALPPIALTGPQRQGLFARLEREKSRHTVRSRLSTVLGVVTAFAILAAIVLVASLLLRAGGPGTSPGAGPSPSPTAQLPTPPVETPYPELPIPPWQRDYPLPTLPPKTPEAGLTVSVASGPIPAAAPPFPAPWSSPPVTPGAGASISLWP